jgi:hypothetical protein
MIFEKAGGDTGLFAGRRPLINMTAKQLSRPFRGG